MKSGIACCFLRNPGASLQNYRGLSILELFFRRKPTDQFHESMDHPWLGPPWTIRGRAARAHRSLASGRSGAQGRQPWGGGQGDGVGEPVKGLTGGRLTARWLGDGGE
jgi:hypothetical protein